MRGGPPNRKRGTSPRPVLRLEHIGSVVDDVAAATAFFTALGLELEGETSVEGDLVDRINGLDGVRADIAMLRTPEGTAQLELVTYNSPSWLCYVRGPAGIIVELAEKIAR